jgi:predicted transglutaminase-like cysteine proteinase
MTIKLAKGLAGLVLALSIGAGLPAQASDRFTTIAKVAAVQPLAMRYFCAEHPAQCRAGGVSEVAMTSDLMTLLKSVNVQVNRSIRPRRDNSDTWSLAPDAGDCEDYVITKRAHLVQAGVPAGSLRIAFTHTRRGEPHAVLVVRSNEGDFVLDNLNNSVKSLQVSGYRIRSMSSSDPKRWIAG